MAVLTEQDVFPWAESVLGGRILDFTRQGGRESGGRPGWFIRVERSGAPERFYLRGERGADFGYTQNYGLLRESRILRLLHSEGIPVPRVIAESERPCAILLEHIEGENDFTTITDPDERDRVARSFAEVMARWHAIPVDRLAGIGLEVPRRREDFLLQDLAVWEAGHFPLIREPVPLVTFACGWLRRNIPSPPARGVLVQGDTGPGQFLFRDSRVQAVVDWELSHIGDPMRELAHIRTRDVWYPTGNLPQWFQYYSEASGTPLDLDRIRYYSVIAMLNSALALGPAVQMLNPRDEHAEWITQEIWSRRATAEVLAEAVGVPLEPIEVPRPEPGYLGMLFDAVEQNLREEQMPCIEEPFQRHRLGMVLRLLTHIRHISEFGREVEALELDDMGTVLGKRPASRLEGQRALDVYVRQAGPGGDAALIRFFHRQAQRDEALMQGAMGRAEGAITPAIE